MNWTTIHIYFIHSEIESRLRRTNHKNSHFANLCTINSLFTIVRDVIYDGPGIAVCDARHSYANDILNKNYNFTSLIFLLLSSLLIVRTESPWARLYNSVWLENYSFLWMDRENVRWLRQLWGGYIVIIRFIGRTHYLHSHGHCCCPIKCTYKAERTEWEKSMFSRPFLHLPLLCVIYAKECEQNVLENHRRLLFIVAPKSIFEYKFIRCNFVRSARVFAMAAPLILRRQMRFWFSVHMFFIQEDGVRSHVRTYVGSAQCVEAAACGRYAHMVGVGVY